MKKSLNGWKIALWGIVGLLISVVLAWLLSYIPWTDNFGFKLGAIIVALAGSVLNLIYSLLKTSVKEKPWLKRTMLIVNIIYWCAWVCHAASLL